jgi:hypothetical protein
MFLSETIWLLISGIVVFIVTGAVFWALLPRGGKTHRFVNTEWEPYISVAICSGVALAFTMMLSSVLNLLGSS